MTNKLYRNTVQKIRVQSVLLKRPCHNLLLAAGIFLASTFVAQAVAILYAANRTTGKIETYNADTGALINNSFVIGLNNPWGVTVDPGNNILYVADYGGNNVKAYNATTGVAIPGFSLSLSGAIDVQVNGSTLFVSSYTGSIGTYNATTGAAITPNFITGTPGIEGITLKDGYLFVVNNANQTVGKYNATTGAMVSNPFIQGWNTPEFITSSGGAIYVTDSSDNKISSYNITNGVAINANLVSLNQAFGVTYDSNNNTIYATGNSDGSIRAYNATTGVALGGFTPIATGNGYGSLAVLSCTPPTITTQPTSALATVGQAVSLSVNNSGTAPFGYQWLKDGVILVGQTNSTLTYTTFAFTNSGSYSVVITNALGMAISLPTSLSMTNATLLSWGNNSYGQLGNGTNGTGIYASLPIAVASNVATVADGGNHSLFMKAGGTLWAMGYNGQGQLGNGTLTSTNLPIYVTNCVVAEAGGYNHSLFVKADGTLWSMGANASGQLGIGNNTDTNRPTYVTNNVVAVSAGGEHSLFVEADGTLWAMGFNWNGELGNGTLTSINRPTYVTNNVVAVAAGYQHSLFMKADGSLWAMGLNDDGQLGIGNNTATNRPIQVTNGVVAVAAGTFHSIFVKADGMLWAMGNNYYGKLGIGTTTKTNRPTYVTNNVAAVAAGGDHSLFMKTDGSLWAMGDNEYGQLGIGSTTESYVPVLVNGGNLLIASLAKGERAYHSLAIVEFLAPNMVVLGTNGAIIASDIGISRVNGTCFPPIALDSTATHTLTITNNGMADLIITGWATNGVNPLVFDLQPSAFTVAVSSSVQFQVTYSPSSVGDHTAALVISNNSPTPAYTINLAGSCYQLSTNIGPYAGCNTVTITNGNFGNITNVLVGGVQAILGAHGTNWVTITLPAIGSDGRKDIIVQTSDNGDITLVRAYTVNLSGVIYGDYWTEIENSLDGKPGMAAATLDNSAYAMGGRGGADVTYTNVYRFDGANWTEVAGLPGFADWHGLSGLGAATLNGALYAVSGVEIYDWDYTYRTNVYRFDGTNWTDAAPVPQGRDLFSAVTLNGAIYAIGGRNASGLLTTNVYRFDGTSWEEVAGLPQARSEYGAAVLDGAIYVIGGNSADGQTNSVYRFDGATWTEVTHLPQIRSDLATITLGNAIYAIGGYSTDTVTNNVYRFDGSTWTEVTGMPHGWAELTAGVLNGTIFAIGGQDSDYNYNANTYLYHETGVTPNTGSYTGGYPVVIVGTNLGNGADITNVTLCGVSVASIVSQSATQVVVVAGVSGSAGLGDVRVVSVSFGETVKSNAFTYTMAQFQFSGTNKTAMVNSNATSTANGTDFGACLVGLQTRTNTFCITNSGNATLNISGISTSGAGAACFTILNPPSVVPISSAVQFSVIFTPQGEQQNAALTFAHDATNSPFVLNLTGFGYAGGIAFDTPALAYNATYAGTNPAAQTVIMTNVGASAFTYTSAVTYGPGASGWLTCIPNAGTVARSGACVLTNTVNSSGLTVGTYYATNCVLAADATNSPQAFVVTLTVIKADQTIAFANPGSQVTTNHVGLSVSTTSGLAVTCTVVSGSAVLTGNTNLTFTGAGAVSIAASQAGDGNWNAAACVTNTFNVTKAVAGVTLNNLSQIYNGAACVVTATTVPSGRTVDMTYNGIASAPTAAGSYVITGTVNNVMYQGGATGTLVVAKAVAPVILSNLAQTYNGASRTATATTTPTGLTVVVTYNASAVTPTNANSYTVIATVAEPNYQGAATDTLVVAKGDQTINFTPIAQQVVTNIVVLAATTTSAGGVSFAVDAGPAAISGGTTLSFSSAGHVQVRATQGGDSNWNPAPDVTNAFTVIGVITNVIPKTGTTFGGTQVMIFGLWLGDGADITNVTLGDVVATIVTQSLHSVTVTAGPSPVATNADVVVQSTGFGTVTLTNGFTYLPVPPAPIALSAIAITSNRFTARWTPAASATNYLIDVSTTNTFASYTGTYQNRNVGDATACLVTGLLDRTTYYYRVRAADFYGPSTNSNVITVPVSTNTPYILYEQTNGVASAGSSDLINMTQLFFGHGMIYTVVSNSNPGLVSASISETNLILRYTAGVTGTAMITVRATAPSGFWVDNTITVSVVPAPSLTLGAIVLNRQNGLYEQIATVTNISATLDAWGVTLTVTNLSANYSLYNATGHDEVGNPEIQWTGNLPSQASRQFTLQYYSATRGTPPSAIVLASLSLENPACLINGASFDINSALLINGTQNFLIEFYAVPGQTYYIQYKAALSDPWKTVYPAIVAPVNKIQWIDCGPPGTECAPNMATTRIYRVIQVVP